MDLAPLVQVLDLAGIRHRERGRLTLKVCCPLAPWRSPPHSSGEDRRPSMGVRVNPTGKSTFKCYCCGAKGKFVLLLEQLSFLTNGSLDKVVELARLEEVKAQLEGVPSPEMEKWHQQDLEELARIPKFLSKVPRYALDRGLTLDTCRFWNLGFDERRSRLVFPVYDTDGNLVGAQGRDISGEKDVELKYYSYAHFPKTLYLYGEHVAFNEQVDPDKPRWLFLVEGPVDVCMSWQNGCRRTVATMGVDLSPEQREKIVSHADLVYLGMDPDGAGERGYRAAVQMLAGRVLLKRVPFPKDKDPGDLKTPEELRRCFSKASLV